MPRRNAITAIKSLALLFLLAWNYALAAPVGQVTNLSGPLFAQNAEGVRRVLSIGSQVEPGDTLITEGKTYAQVRFIDKGVITLKPGTQFKIESFAFDEKAPEKDNAAFGLFKGALRTVTGLVGKRGNQDAYKMNTATATIGIRGTQFVAQYVPGPDEKVSWAPYALPLLAALDLSWTGDTMSDAPSGGLIDGAAMQPFLLAQAGGPPANLVGAGAGAGAGPGGGTLFGGTGPIVGGGSPGGLIGGSSGTGSAVVGGSGGLAPGLYVQVIDGMINLTNGGGTQNFGAGQFGFTGSFTQPPVIIPTNPGITFQPPPTFQQSPTPPGQPGQPGQSGQQNQQQNQGCEMR